MARERPAFTQYVGVKIGVERVALTLTPCFLPHIFPAKYHIQRVEPRAFEPLTSAVQRRMHNIVVVRGCSEVLANKHILPWALSPVFAWVGVNWCRSTCTSANGVIVHVFLQSEQKHKEPTRTLTGTRQGDVSIDLEPDARVSGSLDSPAIRDRLDDGQAPPTT